MKVKDMVHDTFTIDRSYRAPLRKVFHAFADPAIKRRWYAEGEGFEIDEYTVDFRVGGKETARFRFQGGPEIRNDLVYFDIEPEKRIVFAYSMSSAGKPFSVSLSTVTFTEAAGLSKVTYTEQGTFLEGAEGPTGPKSRQAGCRELFERLAKEVEG